MRTSTTCMMKSWMDSVLEQSHGVELHIDALLRVFNDAGTGIAKEFAAQGEGTALRSVDFDVNSEKRLEGRSKKGKGGVWTAEWSWFSARPG